jgi:hypothetical protein
MIVVAPVDDDRLRSGIIKLALVLAWIGKRSDEVGANEYEQVNDSNTLRAIIVAKNNGIRKKAHLTLRNSAARRERSTQMFIKNCTLILFCI